MNGERSLSKNIKLISIKRTRNANINGDIFTYYNKGTKRARQNFSVPDPNAARTRSYDIFAPQVPQAYFVFFLCHFFGTVRVLLDIRRAWQESMKSVSCWDAVPEFLEIWELLRRYCCEDCGLRD